MSPSKRTHQMCISASDQVLSCSYVTSAYLHRSHRQNHKHLHDQCPTRLMKLACLLVLVIIHVTCLPQVVLGQSGDSAEESFLEEFGGPISESRPAYPRAIPISKLEPQHDEVPAKSVPRPVVSASVSNHPHQASTNRSRPRKFLGAITSTTAPKPNADIDFDDDLDDYSDSSEQDMSIVEYIKHLMNETNPRYAYEHLLEGEPGTQAHHVSRAKWQWMLMSRKLSDLSNFVVHKSLPHFIDQADQMNDLPFKCSRALLRVSLGLKKNEPWASKMIDSNGHMPSGGLSGTPTDMGDYDQCVAVREPSNSFRGQYCFLDLRAPLPPKPEKVKIGQPMWNYTGTDLEGTIVEEALKYSAGMYFSGVTNGICIPSSCKAQDLTRVIKELMKGFYMTINITDCDVQHDSLQMNRVQIFFICLLAVYLAFIVFCTCCDIHRERRLASISRDTAKDPTVSPNSIELVKIGNGMKLVYAFSFTRNFKNLFTLSAEGDERLRWIHGTRVICVLWVLIGHTYIMGAAISPQLLYRALDWKDLLQSFSFQPIANAFMSVEVFFFVSGILLVAIGIPMMTERRRGKDIVTFVLVRYIRFIPSVICAMGLNYLWPLASSGPLTRKTLDWLNWQCYQSWWRTIFFVNNWYHLDQVCIAHTWFLSVDFQLHVLSYGIVLGLIYKPRWALRACWAFILIGMIVPGYIAWLKDYYPFPFSTEANMDYLLEELLFKYTATWNHFTPYFGGVIFGWIYLKEVRFPFTRLTKKILWFIFVPISLISLYITYVWTGLEWEPNKVVTVLYLSLHRAAWIIGLAWIFYNCTFYKTGMIRAFLGSKFMLPLSRISYQMYLNHLLLIWFHISNARVPIVGSHYSLLQLASVFWLWTAALSVFTYVLVEQPCYRLMKLVLDIIDRREEKTNKSNKPNGGITPNNNYLKSSMKITTLGADFIDLPQQKKSVFSDAAPTKCYTNRNKSETTNGTSNDQDNDQASDDHQDVMDTEMSAQNDNQTSTRSDLKLTDDDYNQDDNLTQPNSRSARSPSLITNGKPRLSVGQLIAETYPARVDIERGSASD